MKKKKTFFDYIPSFLLISFGVLVFLYIFKDLPDVSGFEEIAVKILAVLFSILLFWQGYLIAVEEKCE